MTTTFTDQLLIYLNHEQHSESGIDIIQGMLYSGQLVIVNSGGILQGYPAQVPSAKTSACLKRGSV